MPVLTHLRHTTHGAVPAASGQQRAALPGTDCQSLGVSTASWAPPSRAFFPRTFVLFHYSWPPLWGGLSVPFRLLE